MNNKTALINGLGITMDAVNPKCEGIYLKDGKIEALGSTKEIKALAEKEGAAIIDLQGKTFLPGLHDCHVHIMTTGMSSIGIDLFNCKSIEEVIKTLEKEKTTSEKEWIYGYGLDESRLIEKRPPTAKELDKNFGKRPVYLVDRGLHYTQVNTIAMEIMKFAGNEEGLGKDEAGNLTGRLHSHANSHARKYFFDKMTWSQREAAIRYTVQTAVKMGVTTIHGMEGGDLSSDEDIPVFLEIMDSLPVHVVLHWCSTKPEEVIAKGLKIIGTDILLDGSIGSRTAAFEEAYADDPNTRGVLYYEDDWITNYIVEAHKNGLQTGFHAIGQRGIVQALNCLERAIQIYPKEDHRFRIEHFGFPDEQDIKRAATLGVVISTQPAFTYLRGGPESVYEDRVGNKRNSRAYPLREFLDAGIVVGGGSDSSVTPIDPVMGIHAAVNPPYAQNAITPEEALRLFTIDGAYCAKEEAVRGSLTPGKAGDITVLSQNPLDVPPEKIKDIKVELTIYQGKVVYKK
ncbi:amidohydrolase [Acetobacterium bakii]|uniref:Amidohydrolase n=1 Tax=Acetobacterium bakii TaxID=52689 RepID=A0A0L6U156_9FIRM|nr:amidohydrolase [Acetobacterium bakii]KNZ42239.1 amidohydrolase [Acetobacterium bakii]